MVAVAIRFDSASDSGFCSGIRFPLGSVVQHENVWRLFGRRVDRYLRWTQSVGQPDSVPKLRSGCFPGSGCQGYGLPVVHLIGRLVIKGLVVPGLIVMPEVPVERQLQVSAILEGS